jgi:hypothetical protein
MEHTIATSIVIPRLKKAQLEIPLPTVQPAAGKGGLKQNMRYDLPRQPHLDPDEQPGISESIKASELPRAAKVALEKLYGNVNRRYVHLEMWIRVSLNEMLEHFGSNGDDAATVKKSMTIIRLALRQYRQTALAETQIVLGVVDAPSNEHRGGVPLLSVTTAVAAAKSRSAKERTNRHLGDGPESKRARVEEEEKASKPGGSENTGASPTTGGRKADSTNSNINAGGGRAGGSGGSSQAKN